jgi:hypothetical protein
MKKIYNLNNAKGGAAVTLICIRNHKKQGWGKVNKDGNIEFFIPEEVNDSIRDELIAKAFSEMLKIKTGQIEIFSGRQDRMIVTILGIDSDQVDLALSALK